MSGYFAGFSRRSGPMQGGGFVRPAPVTGPGEEAVPAISERHVETAGQTMAAVPPTHAAEPSVVERIVERTAEAAPVLPVGPPERTTGRVHELRSAGDPLPIAETEVGSVERPSQVVKTPDIAAPVQAVSDAPGETIVPAPVVPPPRLEIRTVRAADESVDTPEPRMQAPMAAPNAVEPVTAPKRVRFEPPAPVVAAAVKTEPAAETPELRKPPEPTPVVDVKVGSISIEVRAPRREPERKPAIQAPRQTPREPSPLSLSRLYWRGW